MVLLTRSIVVLSIHERNHSRSHVQANGLKDRLSVRRCWRLRTDVMFIRAIYSQNRKHELSHGRKMSHEPWRGGGVGLRWRGETAWSTWGKQGQTWKLQGQDEDRWGKVRKSSGHVLIRKMTIVGTKLVTHTRTHARTHMCVPDYCSDQVLLKSFLPCRRGWVPKTTVGCPSNAGVAKQTGSCSENIL